MTLERCRGQVIPWENGNPRLGRGALSDLSGWGNISANPPTSPALLLCQSSTSSRSFSSGCPSSSRARWRWRRRPRFIRDPNT
ncbi:protein of unknown function [Candidatus Methylocalor cossyra]|uniref:Uncharacterized protein n=1 Tax=Candidatus Methylocalor cossyra TaxID=3108543 RepID=A0ABP1C8Y7_9GAMM